MNSPEVSVLMPMRNAAPYVAAALNSLLADDLNLEIVVIDDGSTDGCADIVRQRKDPRVRLLRGPERGIAACLNMALENSSGTYWMRCDADDLYPPGRIRAQSHWLTENPSYGAICGGFTAIDSKGAMVSQLACDEASPRDVHWEMNRGILMTHLGTFAFRRQFYAAQRFREYFESAEDIDFMLRLGADYPIRYHSANYYLYRLHEHSITHTQAASRRIFFETMAYSFHKERMGSGTDLLSRGAAPLPTDRSGDRPTTAASHMQGMLIGRSWAALGQGKTREAIQTAARAVFAAPACHHGWASLFKLLIKATIGKLQL